MFAKGVNFLIKKVPMYLRKILLQQLHLNIFV